MKRIAIIAVITLVLLASSMPAKAMMFPTVSPGDIQLLSWHDTYHVGDCITVMAWVGAGSGEDAVNGVQAIIDWPENVVSQDWSYPCDDWQEPPHWYEGNILDYYGWDVLANQINGNHVRFVAGKGLDGSDLTYSTIFAYGYFKVTTPGTYTFGYTSDPLISKVTCGTNVCTGALKTLTITVEE